MKKITLLFALIISNLSFSQEKFTYAEVTVDTGVTMKQGVFLKLSDYVIKYSDGSPDELYEKTKAWILKNFKNEEDKILLDKEGESITFQADTKEILRTHTVVSTTKGYQGYRFVVELNFKYGRFKFQPTSLKTYTKDDSLSSGWREQGFSNPVKDYMGNEIAQGKIDVESQVKFFNFLADDLKLFLDDGIIKAEAW